MIKNKNELLSRTQRVRLSVGRGDLRSCRIPPIFMKRLHGKTRGASDFCREGGGRDRRALQICAARPRRGFNYLCGPRPDPFLPSSRNSGGPHAGHPPQFPPRSAGNSQHWSIETLEQRDCRNLPSNCCVTD